jgi:UDP-4-amino-4,6-dideoxy-N-acetyl-beta-L-altrosamine transaminase
VIPYTKHHVNEDDIRAVTDVLRSGPITSGPKIEEFEERFAEAIGARYAVAMSSGTAALHVAMCIAGIGSRDRVVTSPNTFLASANCVVMAGGIVDFLDVEPIAHNLDPELLMRTWQADTKAVIAIDYAGQPCEMPAIYQWAQSKGALVIEDACHSLGSGFLHENRLWAVGSHPWADITIFSFHPAKAITTAEGGMLVTSNQGWADKARRLRSHGIKRHPNDNFYGLGCDTNPCMAERGPWYYEMQDFGFNYRISDIACALGASQLRRLEGFVSRRHEIVNLYNKAFSGISNLVTPALIHPENASHVAWHLYTVEVNFQGLGTCRTDFMRALAERGIGTQVLYIPVHLQPWYRRNFGYGPGKCPVAEAFYTRALSLPLYPAMTEDDVSRVISAVCALLR